MTHRKLIAVDFDGVIHEYTSPWTDAATISDGPTPGAMAFLKALVEDGRFEVVVVSSRLSDEAGGHKVYTWIRNQLEKEFGGAVAFQVYNAIRFEKARPPAQITIDDRGWRFEGTWPGLAELAAFRPWNKRPTVTPEDLGFERVDGEWAAPVEPLSVMLTKETEFKDFSFMERPSLTVLGTTTPADDVMIAAIAAGLTEVEAARRVAAGTHRGHAAILRTMIEVAWEQGRHVGEDGSNSVYCVQGWYNEDWINAKRKEQVDTILTGRAAA